MNFDRQASVDWLIAGTVGIAFGMFCIAIYAFANDSGRHEVPMPTPAISPCYVALKVCQDQLDRKIAPDYIYVLYSAITRIGNAVDSPDGCVRVTGNAGRGIYIVGTEQSILDAIEQAHMKCH